MINRRQFGQAFAATAAAASLAACSTGQGASAAAPSAAPGADLRAGSGKNTSLGTIKQVKAGLLDVGYAEWGPATGKPVILLHGWPYDPHSYVDVGPLLAAAGYHVFAPFLRGFGPTTFLSKDTVRNGQQAAVALDIVAMMDALHLDRVVFGGYDWGVRTVDVIAALWPERVKAMVAVSGYGINNLEANKQPLAPLAEYGWWYQYYLATDRGVAGYAKYRHDFNKLIWKNVSPKWDFDDATYDRTASAFDNPDHVAIVEHNYRWRLSLAPGEPQYDQYERKLATAPTIGVPTITIGSDFDAAAADGKAYRDKFTGKYEHRTFTGIGHNVPQEAPQPFAKAIVDVDKF
ncbi:alpha/beta hydrolase [Amycolatopsis rhabdoformis]|uniref:Alpha/beta hydrolase n=1 Tax=Amycolatopsis rhabdoformis TaxID=1448059 RepID=A0ABZ1HX73_9PSEU|nr:alpha/beta hydrolase [Amycolatopsis rhabdoformis]WSE26211.1 alpha/beta hydrolase [Amycolatopsis rhabdoformis]